MPTPEVEPASSPSGPLPDEDHAQAEESDTADFEAKSAKEKFDEADTAQSENNIRFSAIYHAHTPMCSMHTVE